ncbi:MAG: tyrosine--tRNA ligase [Patescibacteria group bacterium]|nr:tyrosine--tRNA ligase [Patescibacteria group bacterium]
MDKIDQLLTRGIDNVYPTREDLKQILQSGKKLTIYQGFDPTGTQLHIGHMVGFRKLKQWQDLGHKVVFLIGTGTGLAGDPSGKLRSREKFLTEEELKQNAKDYVMQAGKLVRFDGENPVQIVYNGDWLNNLTLPEILDIAGHFTLQQLIERDLFQERMKKGEDVNLREFLYPLLQGYDSVAISADVELGGTDQMFNMLAGRKLVREIQNREKFVMTTPLLTDSEGRKIGKTEGNVIALTDKPEDLFGKIMSLPDDVVLKGFEYLTDVSLEKLSEIELALSSGENPINFKKQLAFDLVKQLNNEKEAKKAQEAFESVVQKKDLPTEIPQFVLPKDKALTTFTDLLVETGLAASKSDARRLIEQGGVEIDNEKIVEPNKETTIKTNAVLKVGKRKFVEIIVED